MPSSYDLYQTQKMAAAVMERALRSDGLNCKSRFCGY